MKAIARGRLIGASLILLLLSVSMALAAPPQCGPLEQVLTALDQKYSERMLWQGKDAQGRLTVITAALDGTTWTALVVTGSVACIADAGASWTHGTPAGTEG